MVDKQTLYDIEITLCYLNQGFYGKALGEGTAVWYYCKRKYGIDINKLLSREFKDTTSTLSKVIQGICICYILK